MITKDFIRENGEQIEELLNDYSSWLEKHYYLDSDWWSEEPKAVLEYLEEKQK